jgi:hypothetical protein
MAVIFLLFPAAKRVDGLSPSGLPQLPEIPSLSERFRRVVVVLATAFVPVIFLYLTGARGV